MMASTLTIIFNGLSKLWQTGLFSDIAIDTGSQLLFLHKVILSAHSPVFQAMFTSNMKETSMSHIPINISPCTAFIDVLRFMYEGAISITNENVGDVLYVADMLLMRDLVELCCEYLSKRLHTSNCIDIMLLADAHTCPDLHQAAVKFACQNLAYVSHTQSFLCLPVQKVIYLLGEEELPCSNEETVLQAVLSWVKFNMPERKHHLYDVLALVRFRSITLRDFDYAVSHIGSTEDKAFQVVIATMRQDLQSHALFRNTRFDKPRRSMHRVLLFGGENVDGTNTLAPSLDSVYSYNCLSNTWSMLSHFNLGRCKHATVVIGNKVYLIGGQHDCYQITSSVECYDVTTETSTSVCPMLTCRKEPMANVINGRIYVSSAAAVDETYTAMEVYDPSCDKWSPYTSNIGWTPAGSNIYQCYKDRLYEVINEKNRCLLRVTPLFLDSDPDSSLDIGVFGECEYPHPPLPYSKQQTALVFTDDCLYLIGGFNATKAHSDCSYCKFVDCLDLQQNKWKRVAPLKYPRAGHTAVSAGGKIYVFGGLQQDGSSTSGYTEVYDPATDIWTSHTQMINFMSSTSVTY